MWHFGTSWDNRQFKAKSLEMDDKDCLNNNKICDIFTKMSYGESYESFSKALVSRRF